MDGLNEIDYGIIGIISIMVLFGLLRGFVREAMSLLTWIVATVLGVMYCDELGNMFTSISIVGVRLLLAFIIIVLVTLIVGGIISHLVAKLIKSTKFSITDRILGVLFGFAKGVAIVALTILAVNPSIFSKKPLWKASILVPEFEPVSLWIKARLPEDLVKLYDNPPQNADDLKKTIDKVTEKTTEKAEKPAENFMLPETDASEDLSNDLSNTDPAG